MRYLLSFFISDSLRSNQIEFIKLFLVVFVINVFDGVKISLSGINVDFGQNKSLANGAFVIITIFGLVYVLRFIREISVYAGKEARSILKDTDVTLAAQHNIDDLGTIDKEIELAVNEIKEKLYSDIFVADNAKFIANILLLIFDFFAPIALTAYSVWRLI